VLVEVAGVEAVVEVLDISHGRPIEHGPVPNFPIARPDMSIRDALALMELAAVDLLPVLDGDAFVGVVTTTEILNLDEILGQASGEPGAT
jgi:CBS domain-containing protein